MSMPPAASGKPASGNLAPPRLSGWLGAVTRQASLPATLKTTALIARPFAALTGLGLLLISAFVLLHLSAGHPDDTSCLLAFVGFTLLFLVGAVAVIGHMLRPVIGALDAEYARTAAILSSIADGVIVRDAAGQVMLANAAARDLLTVDGRFDPALLDGIGPRPAGSPGETVWVEAGGRVIGVSVARITTPRGQTGDEVLVLRDMTVDALAERTRSSFLNQISHELRTPLTAIRGYADTLYHAGERLNPGARARAAQAIFEQTATLATMIDQIIDLAALEDGRRALALQQVELNSLVVGVLMEWHPRLIENGLKAHFEASPPYIHIEGDPRRLRCAVDHLLRNASQFSPTGGDLWVVVGVEGEMASLRISDPGVGISERDLPRVFDRFFRGDARDREGNPVDVRGIGYGLYMVRQIVEAHGGRVEVESELGEGSTFALYLPLAGSVSCPDKTKLDKFA